MKQISDYVNHLMAVPFYLAYVWAAGGFLKKYLGVSKKNDRLFPFFLFGSCLLLDMAGRRYSVLSMFSLVLSSIVFMGLVVLLFQSDKEKRILAATVLMMNERLTGNFCESFLSCLILFFRHTVKKIPEPCLNQWEIGLTGCVSYCFVILAVYWLWKHLEPVFGAKPRKWYVILAVPLLMLVVIIDTASWGASNGVMVRSGGNMGLYYDQIFSHAEFLILTLLCMLAAGFYVFGMNRIYLEQEKNSQYHCQIEVYKMLSEQYRQSERLRHDMKNHIIALSALFQNKEWEKMGEYLKNLEGSSQEAGKDMTGNKAVDALLYQKRKGAREQKTRWECDVRIPRGCCINEFDLCVLFGNILDNALEACERMRDDEHRFIHIQAKTVKKCFLLEVKNSMNMEETYTDGFSNKKNPREHGIGLLNVGDVVHKYNGVLNIEAQNGIFVISILMPLNDAIHDMKTAV